MKKISMVLMTDDELERIKTRKDKTIHILQFAKMSENNLYALRQSVFKGTRDDV